MPGNLTDAQAVRAEMERVLASSRFAESHRLSRFLRFLVEHAVTGGPPLDERLIAAEVFGRPASFVPQLDPVVRVELRRLRAALLEYYQAEGRENPLTIEAPERGYGLVVRGPATDRPAHRRAKRGKFVAFAAALAICAAFWFQFRPHRADLRAAQLDRRARDLRAKGTPSDVALSEGLFEQAVTLDPGYAPAWSGLADVLLSSEAHGAMTRSEAIAKVSQAAREAIKLDPRIGEAHAALACIRFFGGSDWAGAESEFRRAIQLDPSAPRTHRVYAQGLMSRGRFDEAIAQSGIAASLEPAGSPASTDLAEILCAARRYDEATAEARRIVRETAGASAARITLGICLAAAGHYDESIQEFQAALLKGPSLYAMARLGYAYGANGDRAAAEAVLDRLDEAFTRALSIDWSYRALVYAGLGDSQHAVDCMEKSVVNQEGDINFIGVDPAYDRIRSDARFVALRKRLGLP